MEEALKELLKQGPLGIILVVFVYLYLKSLKRCDELADKAYELGTTMVKGDVEVKAALTQVSKDIDGIRGDLRDSD